MNTTTDLEQFLHDQIPLTVAMGVQVLECDDRHLVLTAPLAANRNHLGTAFGGSQQALATLSGYALLWWLLERPQAHIVIRSSTMHFKRPVRGDLRAVCHAPEEADLARFRRDFAHKGKARITLKAALENDGALAAEFHGVFVAVASSPR